MKRNSICAKCALLVLLFFNTALHAQDKHKDTTSNKQPPPENGKKHKTAVINSRVQQVQATKHKKDISFKPGKSAMVSQRKGDLPRKTIPSLTDVHSKEVVTEFPCNANATIILENVMRQVNILTSGNNKVKLVTTVYYQGDPALTDKEWLNKLEISISGNANNVVVTSGNFQNPGSKANTQLNVTKSKPDTVFNSIAIFDSLGNRLNRKSSVNRNIVLYVPAGVKLDIESKYADVILENNIGEVKVRLTNGGLTMMDVNKLTVTSVYGNIYAANLGQAEVTLTNGRLKAKNISILNLNSKNSTIDLDKINELKMISQADQFEIEEAKSISGRKNYGDLRLTTLNGSLDLAGVNADMRIRSISPSVSLIKMDNQYADLRLPVGTLKNYVVAFEGTGGNVYAPFEKFVTTEGSFKSSVGNTNDKPTVFQLKCNNCSVDFK
ncbi:MAG: hypothetical protein ABIN01_15150 [Ferruginibacter sp.]